jgi:PhoPQ-activated pathogenicity-related protein
MVIDMLNMPVSLDYQQQLYGGYSEEIGDYVNLDIPQAVHSEFGNAVVQMIDPYSYREKLALPKLILWRRTIHTGHWMPSKIISTKYPGKTCCIMWPNAGHSMGDKKQAFEALSAFFALTLNGEDYPVSSWEVTEKGKNIRLKVLAKPERLLKAVLWTTSSESRDFRNQLGLKAN